MGIVVGLLWKLSQSQFCKECLHSFVLSLGNIESTFQTTGRFWNTILLLIFFSIFSYPPCPDSCLSCLVFCPLWCMFAIWALVRPALPLKEGVLCFPHSDASLPVVSSLMLAQAFLCYAINQVGELILLKTVPDKKMRKDQFSSRWIFRFVSLVVRQG